MWIIKSVENKMGNEFSTGEYMEQKSKNLREMPLTLLSHLNPSYFLIRGKSYNEKKVPVEKHDFSGKDVH